MIVNGSNETIVLYEGDDYSMTCLGDGIPSPTVVWLMNGLPISIYSGKYNTSYNKTLNDKCF